MKYDAPSVKRNTIKIEILDKMFKANQYKPQYLKDIDRTISCQTIDTMFANKLVALKERYEEHGTIASRDLYDIHHFFLQGYSYNRDLISERRNTDPQLYLIELKEFINAHITQTIIDQGINTIVEYNKFKKIRNSLKAEVLLFIQSEIEGSK